EVEVADHATDDGELLVVLFAEIGAVGGRGGEELGADGGHAAEMAGPEVAAKTFGKPFDLDEGAGLLGVHLFGGGSEEPVDAGFLAGGEIFVEAARIVCEVARLVELRWVDEEGDDGAGAVSGRAADQLDVAGVQRAHGGHKADALAAVAR